jgi:hypothetical protein
MCPHCGQNAPLLYRGVSASCSACGKPRLPFTANAVNLRGRPAKLGGTVAKVAGWILLFGSLAAALLLGAISQAIGGPFLGWVVGGLTAVVGVGLALLLLFGGRALRQSGIHAAEAARLEALSSLAAVQQGIVTSQKAAEALGVPLDEADRFLTHLANQPDSGITLEVDDDGKLTYRFARYAPARAWPGETKMRVDAPPPGERAGQAPLPGGLGSPGGRGATEIMPLADPVGPFGTKVVPARPPSDAPKAGVRVTEVEVVPADDEAPADPRRMRS